MRTRCARPIIAILVVSSWRPFPHPVLLTASSLSSPRCTGSRRHRHRRLVRLLAHFSSLLSFFFSSSRTPHLFTALSARATSARCVALCSSARPIVIVGSFARSPFLSRRVLLPFSFIFFPFLFALSVQHNGPSVDLDARRRAELTFTGPKVARGISLPGTRSYLIGSDGDWAADVHLERQQSARLFLCRPRWGNKCSALGQREMNELEKDNICLLGPPASHEGVRAHHVIATREHASEPFGECRYHAGVSCPGESVKVVVAGWRPASVTAGEHANIGALAREYPGVPCPVPTRPLLPPLSLFFPSSAFSHFQLRNFELACSRINHPFTTSLVFFLPARALLF